MKTRFGWVMIVGTLFALGACAADPADDAADDEDELVDSTSEAAVDANGKCKADTHPFKKKQKCYRKWARTKKGCTINPRNQEVVILCQIEVGQSVLDEGKRLNLEVKQNTHRPKGDTGEYFKIVLTVGGE